MLKHTEYSKAIGEFKDTVIQLTAFFSTTTKEQLNPTEYYIRSGVPFPEVENGVARLKESKLETPKTLENKSQMVKRLETIAQNGKAVKTRFEEMRAITEEFSIVVTKLA
ncbi:hypothetical protein BN59_01528 [Legionella massiliensis]|uniref:Uncharacterized protein n=1 Tax=Legionella massiliensis TaxID=1034943 RepID=A0A078KW73_9GAMM|nr:hypothetical protein [Legionella massiliensis]CDZ77246.1 hypothetical protein BN59_01528 [Legionella massiliensis]CEE12984.1 hypothetical protein BN1094_01528 [Legionella massiliensis]